MLRKFFKEKKKIFIIAALIILILLVIFGTKIVLFFNFITGNDIIIKLETTNEFLFLKHKESETINFKASATTNPFCRAICSSKFEDLSKNKLIEEDSFTLTPGSPIEKEYVLTANELGKGLELYRFSMSCSSESSFLCHTNEEETTTRNMLITLNYDLNEEEKQKKEELKETLSNLVDKTNRDYNDYLHYSKIATRLSNFHSLNNLIKQINKLEKEFSELLKNLQEYTALWDNYEYDKIKDLTPVDIEKFKEETETSLFSHSNLIDEINSIKIKLNSYQENITSENYIEELNLTIIKMNEVINISNKKLGLEEKNSKLGELKIQLSNLDSLIKNSTIENTTYNVSFNRIQDLNLEKIFVEKDNATYINIKFLDPQPKCSIFGEEKTCCTSPECKNDPSNYPTIFIHGHAISKETSAEFSLEGFNQIQNKLEDEGYINAGTITLFTARDFPEGIWSSVNNPLTIRSSYYFDIFEEPENYIVVQTKSNNIDTYSIRLKEIVDTVKLKTGRPKVNIIAFSMGGLVTRRYMQIFGTDDVDKIILIGTPNKGIEGEIADFCPLIGERLECRDMKADSLFMNKLNKGTQPEIKIHNIIGTGCQMNGKLGDGVVLEHRARLENAENYIISGICRSITRPLHLDLRNLNLYPEVYDIILDILK